MKVIVNFIVTVVTFYNVFKVVVTKNDSEEAASGRIAVPAVYSIENVHQWQKPRPFTKHLNNEDDNNFDKIQSPSETLQKHNQYAPVQFNNDLYKNDSINTNPLNTNNNSEEEKNNDQEDYDEEENEAKELENEEDLDDLEEKKEYFALNEDDFFEDPEEIIDNTNLTPKNKYAENEYFQKNIDDNFENKKRKGDRDVHEDEEEDDEEEEYKDDDEDEEQNNEELNYDYEADEEAESQFRPIKTHATQRFIIYQPKDNIAEETVYETNSIPSPVKQSDNKKVPEKFKEEKHSTFKGDKIIKDDKSGKKGYDGHHKYEKVLKGHHKKEKNVDQYDETDGKKKKHHSGYDEEHKDFKSEEGEKKAHFSEDGEHEKGHNTKGMHNIEKIDEFEKNYEFYDEFHEGGESEKHGGHHVDHKHDGGGSLKQKHFVKENGEGKYKKKDFNKHDHNYDENQKGKEGYKKFVIQKQNKKTAKKNLNDGFVVIKY